MSSTPAPAPKAGTSPTRKVIGVIVIAALVLWLGKFTYTQICYENTDDAFIAGHIHDLSPKVDGTITEVLFHDNQAVRKGDTLLKLDPLEYTILKERATAALAQAQSKIESAKADISQAEAAVSQAEARHAQAEAQVAETSAQAKLSKINRQRNEVLFKDGGAVTKSDVDSSNSADDAAQATEKASHANLKASQAAVASARAQLEAARAQSLAANAGVESAQAALKDAERQLDDTTITAPADGTIGNKNAEIGNRLRTGQSVGALVEPTFWVVANFKETQIGRFKAGMPVEITIDALDGKTLKGTIESIAPASGAQFALLPADNATGNFTKVVQRVPVRIAVDPSELSAVQERLRPGLSVVANIRVR